MVRRAYPFFLAGDAITATAGRQTLAVTNKYTGEVAFEVPLASRSEIEQSIASASAAAPEMRRLPMNHRQAVLHHIAGQLQARAEEFARAMVIEVGKPIKDARVEVSRAVDTFTIATDECGQLRDEHQSLEHVPGGRGKGYDAIIRRVPLGPCSFITPFNFPLNLAAHKVAPAIAIGCPFVLKPAPQAPISALLLGEILAEADLPTGAFNIIPCDVADASPLVEDERIKLLSFTGSSAVGWQLKDRAGKKKVVLELGGNAACVVDANLSPSAIDWAVKRIVFGAFYQSGQSCISVQRLMVHDSLYQLFAERLASETVALKAGDPALESTFLGPLISEADVDRVDRWVNEAVNQGANVLCGGTRIDQRFYPATIVENVRNNLALVCEEVFGPVVVMSRFDDFDQALHMVNDSRYGLQAGIFTNNETNMQRAFEELEVGGVIINDVPSFRIDSLPYGGVKDSGIGREGVRYAMQEMSELRVMVRRVHT